MRSHPCIVTVRKRITLRAKCVTDFVLGALFDRCYIYIYMYKMIQMYVMSMCSLVLGRVALENSWNPWQMQNFVGFG